MPFFLSFFLCVDVQLADECRVILEYAIDVRIFYHDNMAAVLLSQTVKSEQVEADVEAFEMDLKNVLEVRPIQSTCLSMCSYIACWCVHVMQIYFHYLTTWVRLSRGHILEEEWRKVKTICTNIRGGEAEAGRKFWYVSLL